MEWRGGRGSGNIEDRRGLGPVGMGGVGIGGLVLAAIGYFVFGINPSDTLSVVGGGGQPAQVQGQRGSPTDEAGKFVDVIETNVDDANQLWNGPGGDGGVLLPERSQGLSGPVVLAGAGDQVRRRRRGGQGLRHRS